VVDIEAGSLEAYGGGPGLLLVARGVADYFRRDFHPWQVDDRALLAEGLLLLDDARSGIAA
jgi:predicted metal-dependent hydrolase